MLKTAARILLLRVLPRRILPIVAVVEALLFLRGIRNRSRVGAAPPNVPRRAPATRSSAPSGATTAPISSERPTSA